VLVSDDVPLAAAAVIVSVCVGPFLWIVYQLFTRTTSAVSIRIVRGFFYVLLAISKVLLRFGLTITLFHHNDNDNSLQQIHTSSKRILDSLFGSRIVMLDESHPVFSPIV
jgi:hypothetical protein